MVRSSRPSDSVRLLADHARILRPIAVAQQPAPTKLFFLRPSTPLFHPARLASRPPSRRLVRVHRVFVQSNFFEQFGRTFDPLRSVVPRPRLRERDIKYRFSVVARTVQPRRAGRR